MSDTSNHKREESEPLHFQENEQHERATYHKRAIYILIGYVPLITVPWILTCVTTTRPLGGQSYYNQQGLTDSEVNSINQWVVAINVLNSIGSLFTIPVLSALLAQAAAVYCEKHRSGPKLQLLQLVALADRVWTDPISMYKSWQWRGSGLKSVRSLLHFAAIVIFLGGIQQPIYQILVPTGSMLVPTCQDTMYMRYGYRRGTLQCPPSVLPPKIVGWDMEPTAIGRMTQKDVFARLISDLAVASLNDVKPHLWINRSDPDADKQTLRDLNSESFAATLEQGTTTGVLREHIMRLNSSVVCERVQRSQFPSDCPGERPFTRSFSFSDSSNSTRVCAPGQFARSPWTMSRNRQDIIEELYIDVFQDIVQGSTGADRRNQTVNSTFRCTANTTRGYFELGNYRNNYTWGPLLSVWPTTDEMETEFNDFAFPDFPTEMAEEPYLNLDDPYSWYVPGPLTMAAVSLFGNNTFFDIATLAWNQSIKDTDTPTVYYDQLCSLVPFARLDPLEVAFEQTVNFPSCDMSPTIMMSRDTLTDQLPSWLHAFNNTNAVNDAIRSAVYLVNEAVLTMDQWRSFYSVGGSGRSANGRTIYSGYGTTIHKPRLSTSAISVITCVLFLELLALAFLVWLIYRAPSRSATLDVMAFSRYKEDMEKSL